MAVEPKTIPQKATAAPVAAANKETNPLRLRDTTSNYLRTVPVS